MKQWSAKNFKSGISILRIVFGPIATGGPTQAFDFDVEESCHDSQNKQCIPRPAQSMVLEQTSERETQI